MGRAPRRAGRDAARRRAPRVRRAPPALGAPLPAAPAHRAGRGRAHREGGDRPQRVGAAVRRAGVGDHRRARRRDRPRSRPGSRALHAPDRDGPPGAAADAVTEGLAARAAHAGVRAQHAARRQVDRRPAAPLRQLDREPQPRQRGERRVGAGARRGGAGPLLDPAALVHAEGAAARYRPARRLRPHGVGRRASRAKSAGTRRRSSCSTRTASFSGELADTARRFFDNPWIDAPARPGKRPGAFCAYTVPSHHPVPVAELDVAPARRAHARARARPRSARVPRARPGRVPPGDAAHARRDRVGVRRDGHVRSAARDGRPIRPSGSRCSRRTSRTRSRRCSARSR